MKKIIIILVLFEQILNFRPKWGDDDGEGANEVDDGQDDGVAGPDFLGGPRGLVLRPIPVPKLWVTTVPDPPGVVRPGCCDSHVLSDGHHPHLLTKPCFGCSSVELESSWRPLEEVLVKLV